MEAVKALLKEENEIERMISTMNQEQGGKERQVELWHPAVFIWEKVVQVAKNKHTTTQGPAFPSSQRELYLEQLGKRKGCDCVHCTVELEYLYCFANLKCISSVQSLSHVRLFATP